MIDVKKFALKGTLTEFEKRFVKDFQGVKDRQTDRIYYCPRDIGFNNLTLDDCGKNSCNDCWKKAKRHLKFRENIIIGGKGISHMSNKNNIDNLVNTYFEQPDKTLKEIFEQYVEDLSEEETDVFYKKIKAIIY